MELAFYSSAGWESWGLSGKPTIPEGMAFLVDDDLLFDDGWGVPGDGGGQRVVAVAADGELLGAVVVGDVRADLAGLDRGGPAARGRDL
ncbi:hypothetical protein ABT009_43955 [Streptomyces sp. NPDC002896]|uniref:hypothetical protein n=1 Tax=Streptomyces sp. NPDC002896 TaxID=3154438 RepID=UPI003327686E